MEMVTVTISLPVSAAPSQLSAAIRGGAVDAIAAGQGAAGGVLMQIAGLVDTAIVWGQSLNQNGG
jgi:hypothetical protein